MKKSYKIMAGTFAAGAAALIIPALVFAKTTHGPAKNFTPPAAMGTVASVSGNTINLTGKNGTPYTINAGSATITKFTPGTGGAKGTTATIALSQVQNGDHLVVTGTASGTTINATKITDGMSFGMRGRRGSGVTGTVNSINGNIISLAGKNGTTYSVDATNAKITKFANGTSNTISLSGVAAGDTLMVAGTINGTSVTATKIVDGTFPAKGSKPANFVKPAVAGKVTAVNQNTVTVSGRNNTSYSVDATNATITKLSNGSKTTISVSGIQTGDMVMVQGTVSGTNVTATAITDGTFGRPGMFGRFQPAK